jgi:hypothetical protein
MKQGNGRRFGLVALALAGTLLAATRPVDADDKGKLKRYESPYYVIHTDLGLESAREAYARMTAMAEEYHQRTKGFSGVIRHRLPFYLFKNPSDYYQAGGVRGSAGMYNGSVLMAVARGNAWKVVQHEGWHQFMHQAVGGNIPIWVNEGLAEYFGEGIWTGDNFVTGVIPPGRLRRIHSLIKKDKTLPFLQMLMMTHQQWSGALNIRNYDQAWSMVHFLVHADDGKYRDAFGRFISDMSRGRAWQKSFVARFGRNVDAFQKRYQDWWLAQKGNPSREQYIRATVEILTSFLARAEAMDQHYEDFDAFIKAAKEGKLAMDPKEMKKAWLPQSLLKSALKNADKLDGWKLVRVRKRARPQLVLRLKDGPTFTGRFVPKAGKAPDVTVKATGG